MTTATKYKSYPEYKAFGIDWLGKIPDGWNMEYMKNLGRFESSGIDKKTIEGEPLVQMVNYTDIYGNESRVIDDKREFMTVSCPAWKVAGANLIRGDLVFTPSSETIEDIGLSALIFDNLINTVFSYHVIRFRFSEKLDHGFKKYLCNNDFVLQQFSSLAKGTTRQVLDRNDFKNIVVVIPPTELQKQIADFLDRKTATIDEVLSKKQKLIELLREKRQTLITQAVTKGLDPKAKIKSSGVEWLGNIPAKWEIRRGKFIFKYKKELNSRYQCDHILALTLRGVINKEDYEMSSLTPTDYASYQIFYPDDLVFKLIDLESRQTSRVGIVSQKGIMSPVYLRIVPVAKIAPRFFYWFYYSLYLQGIFNFLGMGVRSTLNQHDLLMQSVTLPSPQEQKQIVDFLDAETARIDKAVALIDSQIKKLKEYRSSLIYHAVTGKIKV